jgi:ribonuclease VapC
MSDIAVDTSAIVELMIEGPRADVVDRALRAAGVAFVTPVARVDAFDLWGKGRAKAALNFGDCFSYALAKARNVPLLCVGKGFGQTDLQRV